MTKRTLAFEIEAGEATCAHSPGKFCQHAGSKKFGTEPFCCLFEQPLFAATSGEKKGWLLRSKSCLEHEAREEKPSPNTVSLEYPRVDGNRKHVFVDLVDVRASSPLRLSYDFTRDGWIVESIPSDDDGTVEDPWVRLAFVPAWSDASEDVLDLRGTRADVSFGDMECKECASKPGSPTLCHSCLANRSTIERLVRETNELRRAMERVDCFLRDRFYDPPETRDEKLDFCRVILRGALGLDVVDEELEKKRKAKDKDVVPF